MWSVLSVTRKAHASFMAELCGWHNLDYPDALGGDSKARCEARGGLRAGECDLSACPWWSSTHDTTRDRLKAGNLGMRQPENR
jgi:hypothetical protein